MRNDATVPVTRKTVPGMWLHGSWDTPNIDATLNVYTQMLCRSVGDAVEKVCGEELSIG